MISASPSGAKGVIFHRTAFIPTVTLQNQNCASQSPVLEIGRSFFHLANFGATFNKTKQSLYYAAKKNLSAHCNWSTSTSDFGRWRYATTSIALTAANSDAFSSQLCAGNNF